MGDIDQIINQKNMNFPGIYYKNPNNNINRNNNIYDREICV